MKTVYQVNPEKMKEVYAALNDMAVVHGDVEVDSTLWCRRAEAACQLDMKACTVTLVGYAESVRKYFGSMFADYPVIFSMRDMDINRFVK
jgi:uncharacterized metal-binding protein YceD (DUF177 family)